MRVCGPHLKPCCLTLVGRHSLGRGAAWWADALPDFPLSSPERHFQRLSRTLQAATFLDFLWHNMKLSPLPAAPPAL